MSKLLKARVTLLSLLACVALLAVGCPSTSRPPDAQEAVTLRPGEFAVSCEGDTECSETAAEFSILKQCEDAAPLIMTNSSLILWEYLQNNPLGDWNVDTERFDDWVAVTALDPAAATDFADYVAAAGGIDSEFVLPNVVMIFNQAGITFRPGEAPQAASNNSPAALTMTAPPGGNRPVIVVDTGTVGVTGAASVNFANAASSNQSNADTINDDYQGHGPAIADLVGDLLGRPDTDQDREDIFLQRVRTEESAIGGSISAAGVQLRAFDTTAAMATLQGLSDNPDLTLEGAVVNMSFSSPGCPEAFPPNHPIAEWIKREQVIAVASAGNVATEAPEYPAAWAATNDSVISVGGADPASGSGLTTACWTNTHTSITTYAAGIVRVDHPTMGDVTWLGTSFSAPQATAWIAANTANTPINGVAAAIQTSSGPLTMEPSPAPNPGGTC